jgi:dihydroorotase
MPKLLLKQVTVLSKNSPFNGEVVDILIENGLIKTIAKEIINHDQVIEKNLNGCIVTNAFTDVRCNSSEPGLEHRETFESLAVAAQAGGFANIAMLPNATPIRQTKADVEFVINQNQKYGVNFLPLGAITHNLKSDDLVELYDMQNSGAIAFSNANNAIENSGTMSRAIQYSKSFNGLIYSFCFNEALAAGGQVAEGPIAVSLGLKGIPPMAEYLMVQREIELAEYHQAKVHISKVSAEKSVELIRQAKAQGINITADVAVMNLVLTDEALMDFDSNLKLMPPLRQAHDVKALWHGIEDGTIDAICSDHHPQEIEHKDLEFDYASYGAISIQIAFSLAIEGRNRFCSHLDDEIIIEKFTTNANAILNIDNKIIAEGNEALLTIINPHQQTILNKHNNHSLSSNTYYLNKPLPYKIMGTLIGNNYFFNQ